ncbi:uncharacterized protein LOC111005038, partial [Momordica charantia]|uniref:Uncharacterized protein LOC111005038 n=1 Tax=Momordica charantia TaxID=3673 RepID=A0A6J1BS22_MOMCH
MVPFQPLPSSLNDKRVAIRDPTDPLAKKRKWEAQLPPPPPPPQNSIFDIELHLETPLPSDWQRCLDIQSGKIHFYNTTTNKRTSKDPRDQIDKNDDEEEDDDDMSLDLELNLTCDSLDKNSNQTQGGRQDLNGLFGSSENYSNRKEMVAAVCMRCHLLVMLCKSSPECPNCKFMNSPEHTPPAMLKRR